MFEYYLYIDDEYIRVDEQFFKKLVDLYTTKFGVWKSDIDGTAYCEREMTVDKPLFYHLRDTEKNKFIFFAKVYKVEND